MKFIVKKMCKNKARCVIVNDCIIYFNIEIKDRKKELIIKFADFKN